MQITIFPDVKATSLQAYNEPWETFAARFINPPRYPTKHACPLVKLATFGDVRTAAGCLRSEANIISVSGLECDYDAGEMSAETAALLLSATGILAVVYTSPSHTVAKPRWRVLARYPWITLSLPAASLWAVSTRLWAASSPGNRL